MKTLNLDIKSKNVNIGQVEKYDTVKLVVTLEEKDYSNSIIRILGKKADKTVVEQFVQEGNNTIDCVLKDQFISCEGIVRIEVNIVKNGQEWTSNENYFYVSNTLNGEIIESKDSIDTLEKVNKYVENATTELDEFKIIKDDLNSSNETMKVDEESRVTNEIIRGNSENIRITSEKERASSEEIRNKNELERVQAESDRKTNENNRRLAETLRNNAETTRATAEIQRQNAFETNEEIRNENEKLRIANELKRENADKKHNSNENERKANETTRIEAEKLRVQEEAKRKNNEISREKAEEVRQETYTNFNETEIIRKADEITRAANEKLRVAAEETRKITFETNETDRSNTFETNEDTRANAFNSSESTRQTSFEANETTRMNKFNEVERAREVIFERNEDARSSNFELKETARQNAFETNEDTREENENIRKTNETARKTAETKRVNIEKIRVENENARAVNETKRVTAETTRTESEIARVEAEKLREQRFEEMEGSSTLLEMTQEIKEARTDYFGKEHASLKEKEDREFEFVHVDNSKGMFVEQSTNTGHMKIENSIEGKARDSVIKGRTLQNMVVDGNTVKEIGGGGATNAKYDYMFNLKNNTTYTVIIDVDIKNFGTGSQYTISLNNGSNGSHTTNKNGLFVFKIQLNSTFNYNGIWIYCDGGVTGFDGVVKSVIILEDDWTNKIDQIPKEYWEGIKSLGEEENKISILSCGKNLFDEKWLHNKKIVADTGGNIVEDDGTSTWVVTNVKPSTKYKFNKDSHIFEYDSFDNMISYLMVVKANTEFTTSRNTATLKGYKSSVNLENSMLYRTEDNSIYEPYKADKKDILLPVQFGAKGFENGVADEVLPNGDYLQKIDRIVLNGDCAYLNWSNRDGKIGKSFKIPKMKVSSKLISSSLPIYDQLIYDSATKQHVGISSDRATNSINVSLEAIDENDFKTKLNALNLTVYYELAEPILHKAETLQNNNFATFKDITHVSCLNKIAPSSMSGKFPVDMSGTISRLTSENKDLINENKILKLKANSLTIENELQQLDIDTNMLATIDLFEMMLGATRSIKGGDSMVEVYVSMIIKGKKKLEDVPAIIRPQVEQMLRDLGVIA